MHVFFLGRPTYFLMLFLIAYIIPGSVIAALSALMVRELWLIKQPEGPGMETSLLAKRKVRCHHNKNITPPTINNYARISRSIAIFAEV